MWRALTIHPLHLATVLDSGKELYQLFLIPLILFPLPISVSRSSHFRVLKFRFYFVVPEGLSDCVSDVILGMFI